MQPGEKHIINGIEMYFYYWSGEVPVFEYFIDGKQFLFRDSTGK